MIEGPWDREMGLMRQFLKTEALDEAVCVLGSVPHDTFLTLLSRSLAYIRTPITDGVCSSVLESLKLKVPVLAVDNSARPKGTELWKQDDLSSLLALLQEAVADRERMVARIPDIEIDDNAKKLADSIEEVCLRPQDGQVDVLSLSSKA